MVMTSIPRRGTGEETGAYIHVREDFRRRYPNGAQVKRHYMQAAELASKETAYVEGHSIKPSVLFIQPRI